MDTDNIDILEEILKMLGYEKDDSYGKNVDNKSNCKCTIDPSAGADSNCCYNIDLDIYGGFQNIAPGDFVLIGELLGNILADRLPFNASNSIANVLMMIGQILETAASQQQYQQGGPGRFYKPENKNISNPFLVSKFSDLNSNSKDSSDKSYESEIRDMKMRLDEMEKDIKYIKEYIKSMDKK